MSALRPMHGVRFGIRYRVHPGQSGMHFRQRSRITPSNASIHRQFSETFYTRCKKRCAHNSVQRERPCRRNPEHTAATRFRCHSRQKSSSNAAPTIENTYRRMDPVEHVLARPGMYIGSTEEQISSQWVVCPETRRMVRRTVNWSPALQTLFDEIIVNAADNAVRDSSTSRIDVSIHRGERPGRGRKRRCPTISITNDGKGIPIQIHSVENIYVPELIFGHLMTGSNFADESKQLTGGRHGYGAKLTNIFSERFSVTTANAQDKLHYTQTWNGNMSTVSPPTIDNCADIDTDFTQIEFCPDLAKLGLPADEMSEDDYNMLVKRVYDVAGTVAAQNVTVTLNGTAVPVRSFEDYVLLYPGTDSGVVFGHSGSRWKYALCAAPVLPNDRGGSATTTLQNEQISFVNNICTARGGTHVTHIQRQFTKAFSDHLARKHPDLRVSSVGIRNQMQLFVASQVENAAFNSQTKDQLTTPPRDFGSDCTVSARVLRQAVADTAIISNIVASANRKERLLLTNQARGDKSRRKSFIDVPKLEDAVLAGSRASGECTLILTEGDSAKSLAVAGFEVVGRERFGVFPLRGKLLNVRDASTKQLRNNAEISALCKILGLQYDKQYPVDPAKALGLRYGRVLIMTDQDHDGAHIKGLVLNFFHHFWPSLLQRGDFVGEFITPLVKVRRRPAATAKRDTDGTERLFYSLETYMQWWNTVPRAEQRNWHAKYYKGLGTSSSADAKQYFAALDKHVKMFSTLSDGAQKHSPPGTTLDGVEMIDMVFNKSRSADRREWLAHAGAAANTATGDQMSVPPSEHDDTATSLSVQAVSIADFVHTDLAAFAFADNIRSIPSAIDGLKPSQRKVLYACFKRRLSGEVKVAQLAGYVAEHTAYHHGEASLHATITGMAQDFVGANNIPLLIGAGQFGTRHHGGKDAASPRYIYASLSPIARLLFPAADDAVLAWCFDDGVRVEPQCYVPVVPLLLVNGAQGIGTGWSTTVPMHRPRDVIARVRHRLLHQPHGDTDAATLPPLVPWVRGFGGNITVNSDKNSCLHHGRARALAHETTITVDELPIGKWTADYKETLLRMIETGDIDEFSEHHTESTVHFSVTPSERFLGDVDVSDTAALRKKLKLSGSISLNNMHAFDAAGNIQRYDTVDGVLDAFMPVRLALYARRKAHQLDVLSARLSNAANRVRFLSEIIDGDMDITTNTQTKDALVALLASRKYTPYQSGAGAETDAAQADTDLVNSTVDGAAATPSAAGYGYLLNMPIHSFTVERITDENNALRRLQTQVDTLRARSDVDTWLAELDQLEQALLAEDATWHQRG
eukprot:m.1055772 g.1055772  ORF g.1055772 m.1055772 type:complete len:1315 (+) comp24195_c2_seq5:303-4247(+)